MPALSNICIQLIEDSLHELDQARALENEKVVHQLRVLTKRLRAAWHLAQPVCGKNLAQQRRTALAETSAQLAASRDQSVQLALAKKFHQAHPEISEKTLAALFETATLDKQAAHTPSVADTKNAFASETDAWKKVQLGDKERSILRHRWRHSLKKARSLAKKTCQSSSADRWHDWRKAVKRLRYQREFLAMIHPRILGKHDLRIRQLGTRLGDHNDLVIFAKRLTPSAMAAMETAELNQLKKALAMEDRKIKGNCRRLSRKLFG